MQKNKLVVQRKKSEEFKNSDDFKQKERLVLLQSVLVVKQKKNDARKEKQVVHLKILW